MAALSVAERILRRDLERACEEWLQGLRVLDAADNPSDSLTFIAKQMEVVGRDAQRPPPPPPPADSGWPELERANERLNRLRRNGGL